MTVFTRLLHKDSEILRLSTQQSPDLIAIDAPLSLPKKGKLRKAERDMQRKGYAVLPPKFPSMKTLTLRGIKLLEKFSEFELKSRVIEVHPGSTRKALQIPTKDWEKIQVILTHMGLKGELQVRMLTPHEIDAVTAALTGYLHLKGETELIGSDEEGFIVVPKKRHWRELKL